MRARLTISTLLLLFSGLSFAAQRIIEEIIVSAEYVDKSVQDTPISITAMDNHFIEENGITDIEDLMIFTPSLSRDLLDLTIRGIGRNFRTLGGDPGVPAYINGIHADEAILQGSENAFYDLQRVEVLRGPQGTLYGRNAMGGVVNYISNPPTREFFGEVKTCFGAYDTGDIYGVISGPLIRDRLNFRLVGTSVNQGPDRSSRAAPGQTPISDTGGFEDNSLALSLEFTPTDNLEIHVRALQRYYRISPRVPLLIGEGDSNRAQRSSDVCFPEGTDCFDTPARDFLSRPPLNPNANQNLPVNGNGYGDDLENVAYPDFKPDFGFRYNTYSAEVLWHFAHNRYTLRFLAGNLQNPWVGYHRHQFSAPGGRNQCVPPLCEPGDGEQISRHGDFLNYPNHTWSSELQLISNLDGPVNFVAGLYFLDVRRRLEYQRADNAQLGLFTLNPSWGLIDPGEFFSPPRGRGRYSLGSNDAFEINYFGGDPAGTIFWFDSKSETKSLAGYLQGHFEFNEQWRLTAGLRRTTESKTGREWRWIFSEINAEFFGFDSLEEFNRQITTDPLTGEYNGDPLRLAGFPTEIIDSLRVDDDWSKTTWRLALVWTPADETMAYASATTGYRAGGFNLGLHQEFSYDEETVLAYEVGLKTDLFDGRVRVNASAYRYAYDNHQVYANARLAGTTIGCNIGCVGDSSDSFLFQSAVQNVPEARNWGSELELWWHASPVMHMGLTYSYMRTEITSDFFVTREDNPWSAFSSNEDVNLRGAELNRAPRHRFTAWLNYSVPLGDLGNLTFLTTYAYTDEQKFDLLDDRINTAPSQERWDFRASWDSARGKYRVSAFVKNITDELGIVEIRTSENFVRIAETTKPRIWGIEFRMRFGAGTQDSVLFDGPDAN